MKRLADYLVYLVARATGIIFILLPRRVALLLAKAIGNILFLIPNRRKEIAIVNITRTLAVSRSEAAVTVRRLYENLVMNIADFFRFPMLLHKGKILSTVNIVGKEKLDAALSKGRGVILVTGHYGNWEMLAILAVMGYPLYAIIREQSNAYVDKFVNSYRKMLGVKLILKKQIMKDVISTLRKGNIVAFLADQDGGDTGIVLPFLGINASCVKGPVAVALLTNSPVVPVFVVRDNQNYKLYIEDEIPIEKFSDKEKIYSINISRINNIIERYIRLYPDQWFWLHNRWKN